MRILLTSLLALITLTATAATTQPAYAPLPVEYSAPLDDKTTLPLIRIGRLPDGVKSPVNRWTMDSVHYASFRDNQLGSNSIDDKNAAEFAAGKLKLLAPIEKAEIVVAIALPDLPQASVTIGPLIHSDDTLALTIEQWQPQNADRAKSINARRVQLLYLPPLPAGRYRFQVGWHVMTPLNERSGYKWSDYKVGDLWFDVERADGQNVQRDEAPIMSFETLRPVPMPEAPADHATQAPWLTTARWFTDIGDAKEGITVGAGDPFKFLRGDPGQRQKASALPKLDPPASDQSLYARLIAPKVMTAEWASVESITWNGNTATIECNLWTDDGGRSKNIPVHPVMIVQLLPPQMRAGLAPVTPPGHYTVEVVWRKLHTDTPGGWYAEQSRRSERVEFDVR